MTTFGVTMVRNEIDIIEGTLRHITDEVDWVIVADNGSDDGTRELLDTLATNLPITVVDDPEVAYYQSRKMTGLAQLAYEQGAEWVVFFDADELWTANDRIATELATLDASIRVVQAPLWNHFPTAIDPAGTDPFVTIRWRQRQPGALPKVAVRWEPGAVIHQGNHGATLPGPATPACHNVLKVRHFPYRTADQFMTKAINGARAYAATDLPENLGEHWRAYGRIYDQLGPDGLREVFRQNFWHLSPTDADMIEDPAPYRRWVL